MDADFKLYDELNANMRVYFPFIKHFIKHSKNIELLIDIDGHKHLAVAQFIPLDPNVLILRSKECICNIFIIFPLNSVQELPDVPDGWILNSTEFICDESR